MTKEVRIEIYVYDDVVYTEKEFEEKAKEDARFYMENRTIQFSEWLEERYDAADVFYFNKTDKFNVAEGFAVFIFNQLVNNSLSDTIVCEVEV